MPVSDYTPTLPQVGALLRAFTKDSAGNETGTFGTDTRPTATTASELIQQAVDTLSTRAGDDIPPKLFEEGQRLAAIRAAMMIIISFEPEQVRKDNSLYSALKDLWVEGFGDEKHMGTLIQAIEDAAGSGGEVLTDKSGMASFAFPPSSRIGTRRL